MNGLAAIVLAAGGSSRLGSPKQLLVLDGQTLLVRAIEAAREAGCETAIVVIGAEADRMRAELVHQPVTIVENRRWEDGMGGSISAGVIALTLLATPAAILVTLCDQPRIESAQLRRLTDLFESTGRSAASEYSGSLGVPALFTPELFGGLETMEPAHGAKQLIAAHADAFDRVPMPEAELDVDTPEDWRRFSAGSSSR